MADYDGDGLADPAALRYDTAGTQQIGGRNAILTRLSRTGTFNGFEVGYTATDQPIGADFDGDGKADPAEYGFLDDVTFGINYGSATGAGSAQPFPNGSGRFAYIPSSGVYPAHATGALNGTLNLSDAKMVIVNIGGPGDLPAVADYDGDGRADFAVYEPSAAQFLAYGSASFHPDADPSLPANAAKVFPLGLVGDVPASADYLGLGRAEFATYDAASGTFSVRPDGGGDPFTVALGGPGDVPVSSDFEGIGRANFAVYDPRAGVFLVRPSDGSATRVIRVGSPGDVPAVGRWLGDGRVDFGTYSAANGLFHIFGFPNVATTQSLVDPDAIPIQKTNDESVATHAALDAQTGNPSVLFFGDSLTYQWPYQSPTTWQGRIKQFQPSDNGEIFDTSQNVLWRIDHGELDHVHPRVVVLAIGDNDFVDRTPAQLAHTLRVIMDLIHAKLPGSSILLLDLFPRGRQSSSDSPQVQQFDQFVAGEVRDLDQNYLPRLAQPFDLRDLGGYPAGDYSLDLQPSLSANPGDPNNYYANPNFFSELLHPNDLGYQVVANAIATPLRLLLHRPMVPGDFDGDGVTDVGIYAPALGAFAIRFSASGSNVFIPYGNAGVGQALMAPGDYDGDGKTDLAVYRPATGSFLVTVSSSNTAVAVPYGLAGAGQSIPAPGDYDGYGRTDFALYLPALGAFEIHDSRTNTDTFAPLGLPGPGQSIPAPGDYDGDGKTDLAVYLPTLGEFVYRPSAGGADVVVPFGLAGLGQSIPAPGDYDGDGVTDLAVYEPALGGIFAIRASTTGRTTFQAVGLAGAGQSIPAPGDYDGDGKTDLAVYEPTLRGFSIHLSGSGRNEFEPSGVAGVGQSIPVTARDDLVISTSTPSPSLIRAKSLVAPATTSATATPTAAAAKVAATRSHPRRVPQASFAIAPLSRKFASRRLNG